MIMLQNPSEATVDEYSKTRARTNKILNESKD